VLLSKVRKRVRQTVISDIGRRIAELRDAKGWTQEVLAEHVKMATQNVARLEQGRSDFRVSTLVRISRVLGVDVGALFELPSSRRKRKPGRPRKVRLEE
jgi:transcriptional regulator with XRE-family HTH domain